MLMENIGNAQVFKETKLSQEIRQTEPARRIELTPDGTILNVRVVRITPDGVENVSKYPYMEEVVKSSLTIEKDLSGNVKTIKIGRPAAQINSMMSRQHGQIDVTTDGILYTDTKSKNGSTIFGGLLETPKKLSSNTPIKIDTVFHIGIPISRDGYMLLFQAETQKRVETQAEKIAQTEQELMEQLKINRKVQAKTLQKYINVVGGNHEKYQALSKFVERIMETGIEKHEKEDRVINGKVVQVGTMHVEHPYEEGMTPEQLYKEIYQRHTPQNKNTFLDGGEKVVKETDYLLEHPYLLSKGQQLCHRLQTLEAKLP